MKTLTLSDTQFQALKSLIEVLGKGLAEEELEAELIVEEAIADFRVKAEADQLNSEAAIYQLIEFIQEA